MSVSEELDPSGSGSPKVKVFKPKALVLGFHGTVAPIDWEDNYILPFIRLHLREYLTNNWDNTTVSQSILKLRQESFDQHYVYEYKEAPLISNDNDDNLSGQIQSVYNFLIWQMDNNKESKNSQRILKLVWVDGVDRRQFKVPLFEDVLPALKKFKQDLKLKIALFSTVDRQICPKLFTNTTEGDINQYFDQYFDTDTGGSKDMESFKKIANELKVETKDILYVIDYGQSAKCAKELGFQCLLILRPKNREIRKYYFLRFDKIYSLQDIEFVQRQ